MSTLSTFARHSLGLKLFTVTLLVLLLLIPAGMITSLIRERQGRCDEAVAEISGKWGGTQTVSGPILTVPYLVHHKTEKGQPYTETRYARFLPELLEVNGTVYPEVRYRGIYEAVLYNTRLSVIGTFAHPDFSRWGISPENVLWHEAVVCLGVSDMRGIRDSITFNWGGKSFPLEPVPGAFGESRTGLGAGVPVGPAHGTVSFSTDIDLNGSGTLSFVPFGKITTVELSSAWATPSFAGTFLPESRTVGDSGFTARWKVLHFNREFPQQWLNQFYETGNAAFGVELLMPVDGYQKTERTAKYAVLFIGLTFLGFFLMEVMLKRRVHPVQYLLVGFALCLFYALLLSLSEHAGFPGAYAVAGAAVVVIVAGYSRAVLASRKLALFQGGLLTVLYAFLYVVLQLEDYALLMGSAGLFVILASVMYLTRHVDWYGVGKNENEKS